MKKIVFLLFILLLNSQATAQKTQKNRHTNQKTKTTPAVSPAQKSETPPSIDASTLLAQYDFVSLQKHYHTLAAQNSGTLQDSLLQLVKRYERAENMLQATEGIVFVDSMVVDKNQILPNLPLSDEAGFLRNSQEIHQQAHGRSVRVGKWTYINALRNYMLFSASDSVQHLRLFSAHKLGDTWTQPLPIKGIESKYAEPDYPFVLSDGTTIYFAAQGEESIGGYDLFVTRYDAKTRQYQQPASLGMPFNSPANDYFYAIDPLLNLGVLVSDRNQAEGKVCIYTFIVPEQRKSPNTTERLALVQSAQIHNIVQTQQSAQGEIAQLRQKLQRLHNSPNGGKENFTFILNNTQVYTSFQQFRHQEAKIMAQEWLSTQEQLQALQQRHHQTQARYAQERSKNFVLLLNQQEKELHDLRQRIKTLAQNIRKLENSSQH